MGHKRAVAAARIALCVQVKGAPRTRTRAHTRTARVISENRTLTLVRFMIRK